MHSNSFFSLNNFHNIHQFCDFPTDMSTVVACLLFNWSPSFAIGVPARKCAIKWTANLYMDRCHIAWTDGLGARREPWDKAEGDIFWFRISLARSVRSRLSHAGNWSHMFWSTQRWRFSVIISGKVRNWRLHGHQHNTTESSATATPATLLIGSLPVHFRFKPFAVLSWTFWIFCTISFNFYLVAFNCISK